MSDLTPDKEVTQPTLRRSRRHFERTERTTRKKKEQVNVEDNPNNNNGSPLSWIFHRFTSRSSEVKESVSADKVVNSAETKGSSVFVMLSSGDLEENRGEKTGEIEKDDIERKDVLDEILDDLIFSTEQLKGNLKTGCLVVHCKALKKWKETGRLEDWRVIIQSLQMFVELVTDEENVLGKVALSNRFKTELPTKVEYSYATPQSDDIIESLNQELINGMRGIQIL